ncbi:hypothetical protein [Rhodothermus marinus]|uniref:hypothetical protein n=1 Tax=Rhodothermus marinus TaxID=29549 RepID=UPI0012BA5141|nr:hypothetical protein [Rhodothermus marinus]BBM72817.1 hypothetical protein RmaAA338_16820 [Rhodothermus marinus]
MVEPADKVQEPETKASGAAQEQPTPLETLEQTTASGLESVKTWVRENQVVAMVAAFAVGVFLGALWRR